MKRNNLIFLAISFLLLILVALFYRYHIFNHHFVDEEDNLVLGYYLTSGEKLYQDVFSHHQPFAYILSTAIQKKTQPTSVFLLIKRHREFMIFWSLIWGIFLLIRFRTLFIPILLIYELAKIYLFGNLFLADGLVVYPLLYL